MKSVYLHHHCLHPKLLQASAVYVELGTSQSWGQPRALVVYPNHVPLQPPSSIRNVNATYGRNSQTTVVVALHYPQGWNLNISVNFHKKNTNSLQ